MSPPDAPPGGDKPPPDDGPEPRDGPMDPSNRDERSGDEPAGPSLDPPPDGGGNAEVDDEIDKIFREIAEERKKEEEAQREQERRESTERWEREMKTRL